MKVALELLVLVPPDVVTKRFQVPARAPPPVTAVISVGEITLTFLAVIAADPPVVLWLILTVAPATKPVPVIVMTVPPVGGPDFGLTPVTVGVTLGNVTTCGFPIAGP